MVVVLKTEGNMDELEENEAKFQLIHDEIQHRAGIKAMENNNNVEKVDWKTGEFCFVEYEIDDVVEWHRGKVVEVAGENCRVLLIDEDLEINCEVEKMLVMDCFLTDEPPMIFKRRRLSSETLKGEDNIDELEMEQKKIRFEAVSAAYEEACRKQDEEVAKPQEVEERIVDAPREVEIPPPVTSWLPAPTIVGKFVGTPTNIDQFGVITIQDNIQRKTLDKLQEELMRLFPLSSKDSDEVEVGQVVIIHNVFDGLYYRGIIEEKLESDFRVKLVDFGIVEIVERSEIFTKVIAGDIPVQSRQFRMARFFRSTGEWLPKQLDVIQANIIGVEVEVFASETTGDIAECSIPAIEINSTSLKRFESRKASKATENSDDIVIEKVEVVPGNSSEVVKSLETFRSSDAFKSSEPVTRSKSVKSLGTTKSSGTTRSSHYQHISIQFFNVQSTNIKEFGCKLVGVVDCIHVIPEIDALSLSIRQLEHNLSKIDENTLLKLSDRSLKKSFCLVDDGGVWKRGKVLQVTDKVEVLLVDSATHVTLPADKIFKLPTSLTYCPQKTLPILLNGVDHEKLVSDEMTMCKLLVLIDGKNLRAVVRGFSRDLIPIVDLLDETGKLVYQEMIDAKLL
jgi:hypothetical protein